MDGVELIRCSGCKSKYVKTVQKEVFGDADSDHIYKTCHNCRARSWQDKLKQWERTKDHTVNCIMEFFKEQVRTIDDELNLDQIEDILHRYNAIN